MRLWSLHPQYLDRVGLIALWREALLAQKVLSGGTRGYRQHPQLQRFREHPRPLALIASYLRAVASEADNRGYHFDAAKIACHDEAAPSEVSTGQLLFEWEHLLRKLEIRDPARARSHRAGPAPRAHPSFRVVEGRVADWERGLTHGTERAQP